MGDFRDIVFHDEISMEGFQLVPGQYFSKQIEPTLTIWYSSVAFNGRCFTALHDCSSIHLMVNTRDKKVIVTPCPSKDKDAIMWAKPAKKQTYRKMDCTKFARLLFEAWKLNKDYHYRATGRLVSAGERVLLLFDFSDPEAWHGQKLVSTIG